MKILVIEIQWNGGFNGGYTTVMELCRALPEGHELKILGKHFAPDVPDAGTEALDGLGDLACIKNWVTEDGWMPDIIWINRLQELKIGDELSQTLNPDRKIPLVANIRVLEKTKSADETNRLLRLDHLICASKFGTKMWEEVYGFEVSVIPNSVNLNKFKPSFANRQRLKSNLKLNDPNDRLLLYIGRLEQCKGINDLSYMLREAQAARPDLNYHLAIVGRKDSMPRNFKLQLSNLDTSNISIHGFTEHPEEWMQAADVMLVPSRWEELFGKVIVEAMACGLPVLASDRGGIPEILKGDLYHFVMDSPCKPQQWGQAIANLEHENWAETLIASAQEYDACDIACRYIELFEEVIARSNF